MRLRDYMPRSLFGRALLILLMPIVLAQIVTAYVFYDRHWENMVNRLAYGVAGDIALAINFIDRYEGEPARLRDLLSQIERHTDLRLSIDPHGQLPDHSDTNGLVNRTLYNNLALRLPENSFIIIDRTGEKLREVQAHSEQGLLKIEIPARRLQSATATIFIYWMVGSATFFFVIAVVFLRNQIRPIRRLAEAAERFGKGQDASNFKPEGATEVRRAARAFLLMRERIKRQIRQRTEMLAGVSHDLRTPITRMKLQMALMHGKGIEELRQDVSEMEKMVEGYLAFARGDGDEASQKLDLVELLEGVASDARRAGERDVTLTLPASYTIEVRPQAMRRCLVNLVGNALRYGNKVHISLDETDSLLNLHVDDDGPGIPADKRSDVLRPFVRLEESRNQDTGGVGLGLSIACDVARGHGGDLILTDSPLGGLRATVRLPR